MEEDLSQQNIYEINSIVPIIHDLATPISSIEATFILMDTYKIQDKSLKTLIKTGKEALTLTKDILCTKDTLLRNLNIDGFNPRINVFKVKNALFNFSTQEDVLININLNEDILIKGKEHVFERIILNLLSNSINALAKSNKDIKTIDITDKIYKNSYVITIEDNGNGFTSKTFGIGLKVVENNLKKFFKGKLTIDSEINKYSKVNIFFTDFCKK